MNLDANKQRDIWFIFALVVIVLLYEYAPKVASVFVLLIATYLILVPLQKYFQRG